jgi:GDPmannose 4,6-dehydratase
MIKIIISGITGQDGAYLAQFLIKKKYRVYGIVRRSSNDNLIRLNHLGITNKINFLYSDLQEHQRIQSFIKNIKPQLFFNLGAQSFVTFSYNNPIYTDLTNNLATLNILESIKNFSPKTKFYQASSSEMYGNVKINSGLKFLDEESKFDPISPYAISKLSAYFYTKMYRESYNIYASNGILFNHESPLRGDNFVTKKIVKGLVSYAYNKKTPKLRLGNIYSKRDWGDARDYVKYIYKMLTLKNPGDYVLCSNKQYTVKEFINRVAKKLGLKLKWVGKKLQEKAFDSDKIVIEITKKYFRPNDVLNLLGNSNKAKKKLKWRPRQSLDRLINDMIEHEKDFLFKR